MAITTFDTRFRSHYLLDENGIAYGVPKAAGVPRVINQDYLHALAEGDITGHTMYAKLGYNGDVGATEEDIWTQGAVYPWLAAPVALEVVSSSADDAVAGTGIQKVRVGYLDGDYSSQSQVISLAGQTPVPLTDTTILRVNSLRATQVGTGGAAAGLITCRLVGGAATVYRSIVAGFTRGRGAVYTVPLGQTLYLTSIVVSSGHTTVGKLVRWTARAQVDDTDHHVRLPFFMPFFEVQTQDSSFVRVFEIPIVIPATADVKISAVSNGAGAVCTCALRWWLE